MHKFVTEKIKAINSKEPVEQLIIDDVRILDTYEQNLNDTTYKSEFRTILKYIEYAANGGSLPINKMRKYGGKKDGVSEYEFKSKHLRIWAIQQPGKKLIVLGGFKNSQDDNEREFWALKKQYLEFLKDNNGKK